MKKYPGETMIIESIVAKGMGVGESPGRNGDSLTSITNNELNNSNRGMTLMEIVVATAILSICIVATYCAWINAERLNAISREEAIAQAAISKVMSQMRSTAFDSLANSTASGGFSGGLYASGSYRLLPGTFPIYIAGDNLARGVLTSSTRTEGSVQMGDRYYVASEGTAEMRVIIINDENPIERELGEVAGNGDGVDLNSDGIISSSSFPDPGPIDYSVFADTGAEPLFPRALVTGSTLKPHQYRNVSELLVLPVLIQVRWWSKAGIPRELRVVTFLTDRT